jgi:hypothetical protein
MRNFYKGNTAARRSTERETCATARTECFEEGLSVSVGGSTQNGFALSGACAENKSHSPNGTRFASYRCEAKSIHGFIQQLAVGYVARKYRFYVLGSIPAGVDPKKVDNTLIAKYSITASKYVRARENKKGCAKLQYLRFGSFFVLIATKGPHRFRREETQVRDIQTTPIRFAGYSVSFRRGRDRRWHSSVRIDRIEFRFLKRRFERIALSNFETLCSRFAALGFAPYAPVRDQYRQLLRAINKRRKLAGLARIPYLVLPAIRKTMKPFD